MAALEKIKIYHRIDELTGCIDDFLERSDVRAVGDKRHHPRSVYTVNSCVVCVQLSMLECERVIEGGTE